MTLYRVLVALPLLCLLSACDEPASEGSMKAPEQSAEQYQNTTAEPALEERQGTGTGGGE